MYTLEERMKAVELYLKWGRNSAAVRRELGYPSKKALRLWVKEYESTGSLHDGYRPRKPRYSEEQKQAAVKHYLEHGRNLQRSIRALGYPNKATFRQWLDKALPEQKGLHSKRRLEPRVELTTEQKQAAIVDLGSREGPAREVAEKYGVSRVALYRWKNELLGKERPVTKQEHRKPIDSDDKDVLLAKVESLKEQVKALEKQVYRLRLEKDVLEVTAELLKKARAPIPRN